MLLRYYFPHAEEDLEKMHLAAQSFLGEHDFRNFCHLQRKASKRIRRRVYICNKVQQQCYEPDYQECRLFT